MLERSPGSGITRSTAFAADASRSLGLWLRTAPAVPLLGVLAVAQLGLAAFFALHVAHNGFVWYSGGDSTEYWTSAWSLAHGAIPEAVVGYGVPVLWAWVPLVTGSTLLAGLPVIVVLQALVLVPLALVLLWAVADQLFGRLFAWWAAFFFVAAPLLMLAGMRSDYASDFETLFLAPHWYGLTMMADLPSLVAVLGAAWATLRFVARPSSDDALLAGLLLGVAVAVKPANGFFAPAAVVLLLGSRRLKPLVFWIVGLAPALITLSVWKREGVGQLPLSALHASAREALGSAHPIVATIDTNRYVHFDWTHLNQELLDLREVFWSVRVLEFLALAGIVAAVRRSPLKGAFLAVWFAAYCVVKGSSTLASVSATSYWRFVEPGLPAFALLAASLVFLLPRRSTPHAELRPARPLPGGRWTLAAAAGVFAVVPLAVVLSASPWSSPHMVRVDALANDAPLSASLAARSARTATGVSLTWRRPSTSPSTAYFVVYRSTKGDGCQIPTRGSRICQLEMQPVASTRATALRVRPGRPPAWYRIALMANYQNAASGGDLMLLGPAIRVG